MLWIRPDTSFAKRYNPAPLLPFHRHHHNRRPFQLFLSAVDRPRLGAPGSKEGEERKEREGWGLILFYWELDAWMRRWPMNRSKELRRLGSDWLDRLPIDCYLWSPGAHFLTNTTMPATKWRRRANAKGFSPLFFSLLHPQNLSLGIRKNEFKPSIVAAFRNSVVLPPP